MLHPLVAVIGVLLPAAVFGCRVFYAGFSDKVIGEREFFLFLLLELLCSGISIGVMI